MKPRVDHQMINDVEHKYCGACKQFKLLSAFYKATQNWDKLHCHCIQCRTSYNKRTYYKDNKLKDSIVQKNKERQLQVKQFVYDYLKSHPCDCGESDPIVLEFDHIDKETKINSVATLVANKYSLDVVKKEIEKCVVRCANCHRKKTAKDFAWYKDLQH